MTYARAQLGAYLVWQGVCLCAIVGPAAADPLPVAEVTVIDIDAQAELVRIRTPAIGIAPGWRLLLLEPGDNLRWLDFVRRDDEHVVFRIGRPFSTATRARNTRAWLVPPDIVARLRELWPTHAPLLGRVDEIGPGARSAWVLAGTDAGVQVGDSWWLRYGRQPVARLDVRLVERTLCYCTVVPLVAELPAISDQRVALWPAPGRQRTGRARSAVVYVEQRSDEPIAWVAAVPGIACPPEPHVDFYRAERYVGHGVVERHVDCFWFVRVLSKPRPRWPVTSQPATRGTTQTTQATSRPTTSRTSETGVPVLEVSVGDDAVVRTRADVEQRRFAARVFDITPNGAVINAGEIDGLARNDNGTARRDGRVIGDVSIQRLQRSYAVVRLVDSEPDLELRLGDEVRYGPPPISPQLVGIIEQVTDDTLFKARLVSATSAPLLTPLGVRAAGRTVGVAVLLAADGRTGVGFAVDLSLEQPLATGMELTFEPQTDE